MGKFTRAAAIICVAGMLAGVMGVYGYRYFSAGTAPELGTLGIAAAAPLTADAVTPVPVSAGDREVLGPDAKITYRYHYLKDGYMDATTEDVPYFLVGLDRLELAERLPSWELVEFGRDNAIFEKKLNARSTEQYTVGIQNGYVAVFFDEEVNGSLLKEQTAIPVDALSADELSRLETGIRVLGDEQLAKVLEDYGS